MPTLLEEVLKFIRPPSMVKAVALVSAKLRVEALAKIRSSALIVTESSVPSPRVVLPFEAKVVNAPEALVVAPIAVELIPVAVVLKLPEVIVKLLAPKFMDEAPIPVNANDPEVELRFKAPVVRVNPLEAVRVEVKVPVESNVEAPVALKVPLTSRVYAGAVVPTPTLEFEESRLKSPPSTLSAIDELSAMLTLVALTNDNVAPLIVTVSPLESPKVVLPVMFAVPLTDKVDEGAVVPIPIEEFDS